MHARLISSLIRLLRGYERFLFSRAFLGCCYVSVAGCMLYRIFSAISDPWNDVRLARVFALYRGYDFYPPTDDGALLGILYGPLGYLAYAPATLLSTPFGAIACGILISACLSFLPILLVLSNKQLTANADRRMVQLVGCFIFFHFYFAEADRGLWKIHTDASALALCGLVCYFTLRHGEHRTLTWNLALAALCASAAPWTKQTTAPIVLVPLLYFLARGNHAANLRYIASTTVFSLALGGGIVALFGFDRILLNLFRVPAAHPRSLEELLFTGRQIGDFMDDVAVFTVVLLIVLLAQRDESSESEDSRLLDWRVWPLFITTGIVMLPTATLGRIKVGGDANNWALVDYFLTIGIAMLLIRVSATKAFRASPSLPRATTIVLGVLLSAQLLRALPDVGLSRGRFLAYRDHNPSQQAYEFARANPDKTYFPWRTLASLLAEDKLYHAAYGVFDRDLAGFRVSEEHFRKYLPADLECVAYRIHPPPHFLRRRFQDFAARKRVPGLRGWTVLARSDDATCLSD